jgi:hypothetical protein
VCADCTIVYSVVSTTALEHGAVTITVHGPVGMDRADLLTPATFRRLRATLAMAISSTPLVAGINPNYGGFIWDDFLGLNTNVTNTEKSVPPPQDAWNWPSVVEKMVEGEEEVNNYGVLRPENVRVFAIDETSSSSSKEGGGGDVTVSFFVIDNTDTVWYGRSFSS